MTRGWRLDNLPLYVRMQLDGKRRWVRVGTLHVDRYARKDSIPGEADHMVTSNRTIGASFEPDLMEVLRENGLRVGRQEHDSNDPAFVYHQVTAGRVSFGGEVIDEAEWFRGQIPLSADKWYTTD